MARHCTRCGKECSYKSKELCRGCRNNSIRRPDFVCSVCGVQTKHCAKEMCNKCYLSHLHQTSAAFREAHRYSEQKRRQNKPDIVRAQDVARNQTEKRKQWKSEYRKIYYERRKEELQAYNREWMKRNREKMTHYSQNYRHRVEGLPHTLTRQEWREILEEYNHCCAYCGKPGKRFAREHKIPVSRGGGYTRDNIVPACGSCNSQKSNKTPEEFAVYLEEKRRTLQK